MNQNHAETVIACIVTGIQVLGFLCWVAWEWDIFNSRNIQSLTWAAQTKTENYIIKYRPELEFAVDERRNQVIQQIKYPISGLSLDVVKKIREQNFDIIIRNLRSTDTDLSAKPSSLNAKEQALIEFDRQLVSLENTLVKLENCVIKSSDTWRCDSSWGDKFVTNQIKTVNPYIGMINGDWIMYPNINEQIYKWKTRLMFERIMENGDFVVVGKIDEQRKFEEELREILNRGRSR